LHEFKVRQKIEKEYERLLEEEKLYPKGTVLITEEDRVSVLGKLLRSRKEIEEVLSKFPVSSHLHSSKLQKQKSIVERKLEQLDSVIRIFERNKVFLRL
jgi:hypothetical protein